jgi:hypothetical protein
MPTGERFGPVSIGRGNCKSMAVTKACRPSGEMWRTDRSRNRGA